MFSQIASLGLSGIEPFIVSVEVDSRRALPGFDIVGLPDAAVKESRDRVRAAIHNLGYALPDAKIVVNLAPADQKKLGSVYDLPILLAVLCAAGLEDFGFDDTAVIGEIGLSGEIRGIPGVLPMALGAAELGFRRVIVPLPNAAEASVAVGVDVLAAGHAREVLDYFKEAKPLVSAHGIAPVELTDAAAPDLADVKGQTEAKRALEIAAAGGHNLLLIGPPGTGKSMLAKRLPSILPPMTERESVEASKIYSVAGLLRPGAGLLRQRPFRSPHHTVSPAALTGGGPFAKPGDISLAHNGVLFLDELPEYQKPALEVLRQPLEDGAVNISRVRQRLSFPAKCMLVAAMNPCPCGYFGHPSKKCSCSAPAIQRYLGHISGPLLDRIDIHVEVLPVEYDQLAQRSEAEPSAAVRGRVIAARERQLERFRGTAVACNADIPPNLLDDACRLEPAAAKILKAAFDRLGLSARGYDRVLKVARTIADLGGAADIGPAHISQAVQLRSLDRKFWSF